MPFGVELPDNLGETQAPETEVEVKETPEEISNDESQKPQSPELTELDKLERFRFEGRELTPKELKNAMLRQEDYTRKTQEVSEARKYADNFAVDLRKVMSEPELLEQFKRIYPRKYVEMAEEILSRSKPQSQPSTQVQNGLDPKYADKLSRLESKIGEWEESQKKTEIEQIQSWLDNQFGSLSKKYPHAVDDTVTMRAQYLSDNGTKITETVLDKLFKQSHEEMKSRMDKLYLNQANKQLEANKKSKDVGSGGGIPSEAPKGFKTIKDATKAFLEDIDRK